MISQIIEVVLEDLCMYFEEVVGIFKYKECCKEIESCIKFICENFDCVCDVCDEVDKQFEYFNCQVCVVECWKVLKEEQICKEVELCVLEYCVLKGQYDGEGQGLFVVEIVIEKQFVEQCQIEVQLESVCDCYVVVSEYLNEVQVEVYKVGFEIVCVEQQVCYNKEIVECLQCVQGEVECEYVELLVYIVIDCEQIEMLVFVLVEGELKFEVLQ